MQYSETDRLLALAGLYQASWCAQRIAKRGMADSQAMEACVHSLFQTNPPDVAAVFGGVDQVAPGLRQLITQIKNSQNRDMDLTRYVISLMQLERKLENAPDMLQKIGEGLESAEAQRQHFHLLHTNLLARLAELYSDTISTLQPRIMVKGEQLHLGNPDNQNKIRALLLSGIRCARLWRQVGGKRRQILFGRKKLLAQAEQLLSTVVD